MRRGIKHFLRITIALGVFLGLVHILHAITLDRIIEFKEISMTSPNFPQELDGYRVAFVSDTHAMPQRHLDIVVDGVNNWQADILIIGGDISSSQSRYLGHFERVIAALVNVEADDGIFAIEGNHDDFSIIAPLLKEAGVTPLHNDGVHLHEGLFLAGTADLWSGNASILQATRDVDTDGGDFVLLVSHNPDLAMRQNTADVDLILSGHTHGGQWTFLGIFAPYFLRAHITDYGQRFAFGWAQGDDGTPVFVGNGTAVDYYIFPRIFARPQVVLLTLYHGDEVQTLTAGGFWSTPVGITATIILALWNIAVFALYAADKRKSITRRKRIKEAHLIAAALAFGGAGAYFGIYICRHKNRKFGFVVCIGIALIIQILLLFFTMR